MASRGRRLLAFFLAFVMATQPLTPVGEVMMAYADDNAVIVEQEQAQPEEGMQPEEQGSTEGAQVSEEQPATNAAPDEGTGTAGGVSPGTPAAESAAAEPAPADYPEFAQEATVDGVVVKVAAEQGAFPADAILKVTKVAFTDELSDAVGEAS